MNVIFHVTAAVGIIAALNDSRDTSKSTEKQLTKGIVAFSVGVVSHGALDYIPHCYPIDPKIDVTVGCIIIGSLLYFSKPEYRVIIGLTFLGCIFPDLIDLSPQILNKYIGTSIPIRDKLFPWHWEKYSGSIFADDCGTSTFNHICLCVIVVITCFFRKTDLKHIFCRDNTSS